MHRMTYSSYTGIRSTKNVHPEICSPDGRLDIDIFSLFYFFAFHSGIFAVINFTFGFAIRADFEVTGSFLFRQFGHERYGFVFVDGFYFFVSAFFLCAAVDFVTGSLGYFFPGESDFVFSGIFDGSQCRFGRCIFFASFAAFSRSAFSFSAVSRSAFFCGYSASQADTLCSA